MLRLFIVMVVFRESFMRYGVSFGTALAISISFYYNESILWAIVHGILGWVYVAYRGLVL